MSSTRGAKRWIRTAWSLSYRESWQTQMLDKLDPYRVIHIKKPHYCEEALQQEAINIIRSDTNRWNLLIPTQYKGKRIILHKTDGKKESYKMCGLPTGASVVDFSQSIH